jgi:hypothetical protein
MPTPAQLQVQNPFAGIVDAAVDLAMQYILPDIVSLPTPEGLYDQLMGAIEPELTSESILALTDKYKTETPAQAAARKERYQHAFAEYKTRYMAYSEELANAVHAFEHMALKTAEKMSKQDEEAYEKEISDAISSLSQ